MKETKVIPYIFFKTSDKIRGLKPNFSASIIFSENIKSMDGSNHQERITNGPTIASCTLQSIAEKPSQPRRYGIQDLKLKWGGEKQASLPLRSFRTDTHFGEHFPWKLFPGNDSMPFTGLYITGSC